VNEPGARGNTPLMQLTGSGYAPAVEYRLVEQMVRLGADVNARDDFGTTALRLAAHRGKTDLVHLLLSMGADPRVVNCHGVTAASLAQFGGHAALAANCYPILTLTNSDNFTRLHLKVATKPEVTRMGVESLSLISFLTVSD
jgi:ankyrin repeat protein